jgi:hypothetical protein
MIFLRSTNATAAPCQTGLFPAVATMSWRGACPVDARRRADRSVQDLHPIKCVARQNIPFTNWNGAAPCLHPWSADLREWRTAVRPEEGPRRPGRRQRASASTPRRPEGHRSQSEGPEDLCDARLRGFQSLWAASHPIVIPSEVEGSLVRRRAWSVRAGIAGTMMRVSIGDSRASETNEIHFGCAQGRLSTSLGMTTERALRG